MESVSDAQGFARERLACKHSRTMKEGVDVSNSCNHAYFKPISRVDKPILPMFLE
jgi:hypothetical protein